LLTLLERAAKNGGAVNGHQHANGDAAIPGSAAFDPMAVSETLWENWQANVKQHGVLNEPLGRFLDSLHKLPRIHWMTPLADYVDASLEEIRRKKTHGRKRVAAVIEAFGALDALLPREPLKQFAVRIVPAFAVPIEAWLMEALDRSDTPTFTEVRRQAIEPILDQVRRDVGDVVADLAAGRLRLNKQHRSAKQAAHALGRTRARVYQLIGEASEVMRVRWPQGEYLLAALRQRADAQTLAADKRAGELLARALEVFYPRVVT